MRKWAPLKSAFIQTKVILVDESHLRISIIAEAYLVSGLVAHAQENTQLQYFLRTGSTNEVIAEIERLSARKETKLICEALKHKVINVQLHALSGLTLAPERVLLPTVLDCLEKNNYLFEGKEDSTSHDGLKMMAIVYIEKVTGRSMGIKNIYDEKEIAAAIAAVRNAK